MLFRSRIRVLANDRVDIPNVKGAQSAVVSGDPKKGPYAMLVKWPAGFNPPLHTHPNTVKVLVVSGTFLHGDDGQQRKELGSGSYVVIPAMTKHVSSCKEGAECVFFVEGTGKFATTPVEDKKEK